MLKVWCEVLSSSDSGFHSLSINPLPKCVPVRAARVSPSSGAQPSAVPVFLGRGVGAETGELWPCWEAASVGRVAQVANGS